jgi:large subunit ribosomal protein L19
MKTTDIVDKQSLRTDIPKIGPGDEVKVHVRVVESGKYNFSLRIRHR